MCACLPPDLVSQAINQVAGCICSERRKEEENEDRVQPKIQQGFLFSTHPMLGRKLGQARQGQNEGVCQRNGVPSGHHWALTSFPFMLVSLPRFFFLTQQYVS